MRIDKITKYYLQNIKIYPNYQLFKIIYDHIAKLQSAYSHKHQNVIDSEIYKGIKNKEIKDDKIFQQDIIDSINKDSDDSDDCRSQSNNNLIMSNNRAKSNTSNERSLASVEDFIQIITVCEWEISRSTSK